jgi:hypothetical protein
VCEKCENLQDIFFSICRRNIWESKSRLIERAKAIPELKAKVYENKQLAQGFLQSEWQAATWSSMLLYTKKISKNQYLLQFTDKNIITVLKGGGGNATIYQANRIHKLFVQTSIDHSPHQSRRVLTCRRLRWQKPITTAVAHQILHSCGRPLCSCGFIPRAIRMAAFGRKQEYRSLLAHFIRL